MRRGYWHDGRWSPPSPAELAAERRRERAERRAGAALERAGVYAEILAACRAAEAAGRECYEEIEWRGAVEALARALLAQRDDVLPAVRLAPVMAEELRGLVDRAGLWATRPARAACRPTTATRRRNRSTTARRGQAKSPGHPATCGATGAWCAGQREGEAASGRTARVEEPAGELRGRHRELVRRGADAHPHALRRRG